MSICIIKLDNRFIGIPGNYFQTALRLPANDALFFLRTKPYIAGSEVDKVAKNGYMDFDAREPVQIGEHFVYTRGRA